MLILDGASEFMALGWSSVAKKSLMALTGLFLCLFLVVHLLGNAFLFLPPDQAQGTFNKYAAILSSLWFIKIAAYGTYLCIIAHALMAASLAWSNRRAAGIRNHQEDNASTSSWHTRWMGVLGSILLVFIIVHMWDFWFPFKFGTAAGKDSFGNKDLYSLVAGSFRNVFYVIFYLLAMVALALHLFQGFYNGLRSLGLYHPTYSLWARRLSQIFAIVISLGFAAMPVYLYLIQYNAKP